MKNWFTIHDSDELDSPALVIYPLRVKENIDLLKRMIDDPHRLRPHVKTHKTKEASAMMIEAGIHKFKCATIAEAEMLAMASAPDVLLAYQPVGPKLQRFISLIKQYSATGFSCLVDNIQTANNISSAAIQAKVVVHLYIDLNVGMNRTGMAPGKNAVALYRYCSWLEGIEPVGFHFYDGHIRDKDIEKRRLACNEIFAGVEQMRIQLTEAGYDNPKLVAGGSPSFPIYAMEKEVECSPGTFIFWDKGYQDSLPEQNFLTAALVVTRIISIPGERKICVDMGYKSIASENAIDNRVHFLSAPDLVIVSHSEEHMVLETPAAHSWKVGDMLYALPVHICPTIALYESASIIENGNITGNWKIIARDRKIKL